MEEIEILRAAQEANIVNEAATISETSNQNEDFSMPWHYFTHFHETMIKLGSYGFLIYFVYEHLWPMAIEYALRKIRQRQRGMLSASSNPFS